MRVQCIRIVHATVTRLYIKVCDSHNFATPAKAVFVALEKDLDKLVCL